MDTQKLTAELMHRMLSAEGDLTVTRQLGTYRLRFENGQPVLRTQDVFLEPETAAVREWAAGFPELTVTYPQRKTAELYPAEDGDVRIEEYTLTAEIFVPGEYTEKHSGIGFRNMLETKWEKQTGELAEAVCKRLKKHEFRTLRMFGKGAFARSLTVYVTSEAVRTDIWMLPFARFGLYPLLWDIEICGMALLLREKLRAAFSEALETNTELRVTRAEPEQCCLLMPVPVTEEETICEQS